MTKPKAIILAEWSSHNRRWRFIAYTAAGATRSLRSWATKRAALAAGRREYRVDPDQERTHA